MTKSLSGVLRVLHFAHGHVDRVYKEVRPKGLACAIRS